MELGDTDIQQSTKSLQQLAGFVAFAASVRGYTSSLAAIERIGQQLGSFATSNKSVLQVSAPLLGAGSGGLRSQDVVEHLTRGFLETAPERATLKIFVLHEDLFQQLRAAFSTRSIEASQSEVKQDFVPIRAFISYTRTSEEHSSWVKELAIFLREQGIESRLDQWHLLPGQDAAQWMCNEVALADRVLMICNEEYASRADGRHGGVGWEVRIIQGYLMEEGVNNPSKFVPIVRTSERSAGLPSFLLSTYCIHWPYSRNNDVKLRHELVKILYKIKDEAPPIGRPPSFVIEALKKRTFDNLHTRGS
jgi:hypothetical protein